MSASGSPVATARHPGIRDTWQSSPAPAKAIIVGLFVQKLGAFLQVFLVLYLIHRGLSSTHASLALGLHGAGSIAGVLLGGRLSDWAGPRRVIVASMSGSAVLTVALLYVAGLGAVLLVACSLGLISQLYRPAAASLLAALTPARAQVMVFAMHRLALNLGTTVAPLLGAALASVSFSLLFWVEACAMLGYAAVAMAALPSQALPSRTPPSRTPPSPPTRPAAPTVPAEGRADPLLPPSRFPVLADRRFVLFLAATLLNSVIYVQYLSTLPLAVTANGMGTGAYGVLVALNGALVISFELLVTRYSQRRSARLAVAVGLMLGGVGLTLYAVPLGLAWFVLATAVWTFGEIVSAPIMSAYPATAAPAPLRGRYIAAAQAMFGLGFAVGPLVGAMAWNALGATMWWCCGAVGTLAAAVAWRGVRQGTQDREVADAARGAG